MRIISHSLSADVPILRVIVKNVLWKRQKWLVPLLKLARALLMRKGIEASVKSRVLLVRLEDEGLLSVILSLIHI